MTQDDLKFMFEVLQTYRFMMASAFAGSVPSNKELKSYMAKCANIQDKLKKQITR